MRTTTTYSLLTATSLSRESHLTCFSGIEMREEKKTLHALIRSLTVGLVYSKIFICVESNSCLFWPFFTSLCDWFKNFSPPSQPIRKKNNCAFVARVFPRLAPIASICLSSDWFIMFFASVVISQSNCFTSFSPKF